MIEPKDYPKLIQVKDASYHIVFMKRLKDDAYGMCDDDAKLILISLNQSLDEMLKTFWHEVLHAVEKEYKMLLGHRKIEKLEDAIARVQSQLPDNQGR